MKLYLDKSRLRDINNANAHALKTYQPRIQILSHPEAFPESLYPLSISNQTFCSCTSAFLKLQRAFQHSHPPKYIHAADFQSLSLQLSSIYPNSRIFQYIAACSPYSVPELQE